jgi:hypothetical protein
MASLPRRRKPSVPIAEAFADIRCSGASEFDSGFRAVRAKHFGFKSLMHFSYYLMIAALTLVGFEVVYALCQLAAFVL